MSSVAIYNPVAVLQHNIISRGRRGFIACPQNPVAELLKLPCIYMTCTGPAAF